MDTDNEVALVISLSKSRAPVILIAPRPALPPIIPDTVKVALPTSIVKASVSDEDQPPDNINADMLLSAKPPAVSENLTVKEDEPELLFTVSVAPVGP